MLIDFDFGFTGLDLDWLCGFCLFWGKLEGLLVVCLTFCGGLCGLCVRLLVWLERFREVEGCAAGWKAKFDAADFPGVGMVSLRF